LLLLPRRDEKEVDVGANSIGIVEPILSIGVAMPGVRLPRKIVRNIHKSRSVIRLIVKLVAENLRSLAEVELVSVSHDPRVKNSGEVSLRMPTKTSKRHSWFLYLQNAIVDTTSFAAIATDGLRPGS
jgi:hypothetical protein